MGIQYGIVHGEYMVDEKGPVLIEVNCRPMGCSMPSEYLDLVFGQHETDTLLDSYLDEKGFMLDLEKPYRPLRKCVLKMIIGLQKSLLSLSEYECLSLIFSIIDRVRPGGRVIVPANTYEYLSYKKEGAELLLQIKGLHIEQPLMRRKGYVIGISQ